MIRRLSPYLALAQIRPHLLNRPRVDRPTPAPKMHGTPANTLEYLRNLHCRFMGRFVDPSRIPRDAEGLPSAVVDAELRVLGTF